MLKFAYRMTKPWALANKSDILWNKAVGKITAALYIIYVHVKKIHNDTNKTVDCIISLTSFPARINGLYYCLNSLLRQSVRPRRIILWLAESQFPHKSKSLPKRIIKLKRFGLEIRYCEDLRSYKKVFYSAQKYKDKCLITVDDDTLYPEDWLVRLIDNYKRFPNCVSCYRAHLITVQNGIVQPYEKWEKLSPSVYTKNNRLLPVGVGGVLYPPNYFDGVDFDWNLIKKIAPTTDDLWLKVIGLKKGIPAVKVDRYSKEFFTVLGTQKQRLVAENVETDNKNDIAFTNLLEHYQVNSL